MACLICVQKNATAGTVRKSAGNGKWLFGIVYGHRSTARPQNIIIEEQHGRREYRLLACTATVNAVGGSGEASSVAAEKELCGSCNLDFKTTPLCATRMGDFSCVVFRALPGRPLS